MHRARCIHHRGGVAPPGGSAHAPPAMSARPLLGVLRVLSLLGLALTACTKSRSSVTADDAAPRGADDHLTVTLGESGTPSFVTVELDLPSGFRLQRSQPTSNTVDFFAPMEKMTAVTLSRLPCQAGDDSSGCAARWQQTLHMEKSVVHETDDEVHIERADGSGWLLHQRWLASPGRDFFLSCSAQARDEKTLAARRAACASMKARW